MTPQDTDHSREASYNATVTEIVDVAEGLRLLRVRPDAGVPAFEPGQYFSLGLGNWEPRVEGSGVEESSPARNANLVKRAYSVSCSLHMEGNRVLRPCEYDYLEFYVRLAPQIGDFPPALTPRLFALKAPGRIFMTEKAHGRYTLASVSPGADVWFFATGTGEAPHNAMIAELLGRGHVGRVMHVVCVRYRRDAAYHGAHLALSRRLPRYHYLLLTTREPENLDPSAANYVGKQYIQSALQTGFLERSIGARLDPETAQVFVCGSPSMVGAPPPGHHGEELSARPGSVLDVLVHLGFRLDRPGRGGNAHWEEYD